MHTTASDGTCSPAQLVGLVRAAGITAFSVTDHDTTGALRDVRELAGHAGLEFVPGIEITSVVDGHDVHVLGYAFDEASAPLQEFLRAQREDRVRRAREIGRRLADLGAAIDVEAVIAAAARQGGRAVGRPLVADALVRAGHASSRRDAFDRFLGRDQPAFVPRCGAAPDEVVEVLTRARGLASIAHPGLVHVPLDVDGLARRGLAAIEVYHSDHDATQRAHFSRLAEQLGLAVSGGSDFHGEDVSRPRPLGRVSLPRRHYDRLLSVARERECASVPGHALAG